MLIEPLASKGWPSSSLTSINEAASADLGFAVETISAIKTLAAIAILLAFGCPSSSAKIACMTPPLVASGDCATSLATSSTIFLSAGENRPRTFLM